MGMNYGNVTKASFQADIKRKQAFFNRCKRRFKVANTTGEKQFLKGEASRVVTELKQSCKKWKTCGFGACMWITKNFTVTNFNAARTGVKSKTSAARKSSARKTTTAGRSSVRKSTKGSYAKRSTSSRPKSRTTSRTRAARKSYVAW